MARRGFRKVRAGCGECASRSAALPCSPPVVGGVWLLCLFADALRTGPLFAFGWVASALGPPLLRAVTLTAPGGPSGRLLPLPPAACALGPPLLSGGRLAGLPAQRVPPRAPPWVASPVGLPLLRAASRPRRRSRRALGFVRVPGGSHPRWWPPRPGVALAPAGASSLRLALGSSC